MSFARARGLANIVRYPRVSSYYEEYLKRHAPGTDVLDVGAMWRVNGAYSFCAHDVGAKSVTALDILKATPRFQEQNTQRADAVRFVQADLLEQSLPERLGTFDVVFCCGVLYHLPNPLLGIERLRAFTRSRLLLGSWTIPDGWLGNRVVFYPHLSHVARALLAFPGDGGRLGLDLPFQEQAAYANWFWGLSASAIRAMLKVAGFEVQHVHHRPGAAIFECRAR